MSEATPEVADEGDKNKHARRLAGTGFPSMPLGEAVALTRKIATYGTTHTDAAVASFLGHSTANSGAFRSKVAALSYYGLLTTKNGEMTVSPLALEIVHPGLEADPDASLRAAFAKCKPFVNVLDSLPKDHPLEIAGLANTAFHNHGVAAQSKEAFTASFVASGTLAGLIEKIDDTHIRIPSGGATTSNDESGQIEEVAPELPVKNKSVRTPSFEATNAVVNHTWPIEGGVVRFIVETSITLPATAYGLIGTVISEGDKLAEMLKPARVTEHGASADSE